MENSHIQQLISELEESGKIQNFGQISKENFLEVHFIS